MILRMIAVALLVGTSRAYPQGVRQDGEDPSAVPSREYRDVYEGVVQDLQYSDNIAAARSYETRVLSQTFVDREQSRHANNTSAPREHSIIRTGADQQNRNTAQYYRVPVVTPTESIFTPKGRTVDEKQLVSALISQGVRSAAFLMTPNSHREEHNRSSVPQNSRLTDAAVQHNLTNASTFQHNHNGNWNNMMSNQHMDNETKPDVLPLQHVHNTPRARQSQKNTTGTRHTDTVPKRDVHSAHQNKNVTQIVMSTGSINNSVSHTGQGVVMHFNHSERVLYTEDPAMSRKKNQWTLKGRNTTESENTSSGESKIVFPGEMESNTVVKFTPQVDGKRPKCAEGSTFCVSADTYPHEYLKSVLENDVSISPMYLERDLVDISIRMQPDDSELCSSVEDVVYPKMAQNKDDKWLFVVNQDTYLQGVRIEKCGRQTTCSFSELFPNGYETSCQQKYIFRKLVALGEDGKPVSDSFRLPSCCSCILTKLQATSRIGKAQSPADGRKRRRRSGR